MSLACLLRLRHDGDQCKNALAIENEGGNLRQVRVALFALTAMRAYRCQPKAR
jgi:hypothetical protein